MNVTDQNTDIPLAYLFFKEGFNLTGYECAKTLDITERYLFDKLKTSFDYVVADKGATKCFNLNYLHKYYSVYATEINELAEKYGSNIDEYLKFLGRRKVFINRESYKDYLRTDLKLVQERVRFSLPLEEIPKNLTLGEIYFIIDNSPTIKEYDYSAALSDETLDGIIDGDIKLYSPKQLKHYVQVNGKTVYDTQLYRWLNRRAGVSKLHLTTTSDERPVVRYVFNIDEFKYFNTPGMFSVDARCYYDGYESDLLDRLNIFSSQKEDEK